MDDKDTLLRGAKAFTNRYAHLSAENQRIALSAKRPQDLQRIAGDGAEELFQNLEAFRRLEAEGFNFTLTEASPPQKLPFGCNWKQSWWSTRQYWSLSCSRSAKPNERQKL